jgi:Fe-Mn family superoxide dismutase
MAFELPPLPYAKNALEPHISANTLDFHHGKHHQAYVTALNNLVKDSPLEKQSLEEIIRSAHGDASKAALFNNAAQVWNHTFFWNCMKKDAGGPSGDLARAIDRDLGGLAKFKEDFKAAAVGQFGSGWAWLVADGGKLRITRTPNAVNPVAEGGTALLTCDVWEHAYYLDYQNRRPDFVQAFLDHLINWDFVAQNLAKAR